jgi:hypothetical protein
VFRAIAFKEWLKIRWAAFVLLAVSLVVLAETALSLRHDMQFNAPIAVWNAVVLLGYQYYGHLRYLPLAIGVVIAAAQFLPEAAQGRLALSLHLPLRENQMMLRMLAVGFGAVAAFVALLLVLMTSIGAVYFPWQILWTALLDMAPWSLAGCAAYLVVSAAIVEPRWVRRGVLLLACAGLADLLLAYTGSGSYAPALPFFLILAGCSSVAVLVSAHRFRRGVR